MRMTPIADYVLAPGELVEFRIPSPVLRKAAAAPVHPAPPSHLQENHIRRLLANRAADRPHSAWIALAFDLPGRLDAQAMAAALAAWVRRHPTLLTWFAPDGDRLRRHAVPAEVVAVESVPCGTYASGEALRDRMHASFDAGTDPLEWPPFVAGAVLRGGDADAPGRKGQKGQEGGSSTVWLAVDHSHSDGYSMLMVFGELRALYEAELTGTPADLPEAGSYVDYCALERERAALIGPDAPAVRRWVEFFSEGPPPAFPLDLGTEPGGAHPGVSLEMDVLDAAGSDAFARACKAQGAGFLAGVLAALAVTGRDLGGPDHYRGLTVLHTRDEHRWQRTHGWFINLAPVRFAAAGRFAGVVAGAQQALREAREPAGVSPVRVMELVAGVAGAVQADATAVLPMVSYVDCRHAPGARDWAGARCTGLAGPGLSPDVPVWVNRLWDCTYLKSRYPDTPVARENVPRFMAHFAEVMRTVARTGDWPCG
ncbi:condensation domain-containing protein [Streptomyces sp. NPDC008001]|uniref:condensation domain-containing protein n=1 Tax=Streptomyces sp. NPDC008001 TaxID=3364804 RepID=UPI0036E22FE7